MECSCSENYTGGDCLHISYCSDALPIARTILRKEIGLRRNISKDNWRCVALGPREGQTSAIWIAIRNDAVTPNDISFVPVVEARDRKHLYMALRRRLRCLHCRRSSSNRGLCEHENCAMVTAHLLDDTSCKESKEADERFEDDDDEMDGGTEDAVAQTQREGRERFISKLPRRILPCQMQFLIFFLE